MDKVDREILQLLTDNGRLSYVDIEKAWSFQSGCAGKSQSLSGKRCN